MDHETPLLAAGPVAGCPRLPGCILLAWPRIPRASLTEELSKN
jgi:hypothetical protein